MVADLDDIGIRVSGVAVLRKGWGGSVPLIALTRSPDVDDHARNVSAVAGLRKPLNVER
jgi:hypothetical protein